MPENQNKNNQDIYKNFNKLIKENPYLFSHSGIFYGGKDNEISMETFELFAYFLDQLFIKNVFSRNTVNLVSYVNFIKSQEIDQELKDKILKKIEILPTGIVKANPYKNTLFEFAEIIVGLGILEEPKNLRNLYRDHFSKAINFEPAKQIESVNNFETQISPVITARNTQVEPNFTTVDNQPKTVSSTKTNIFNTSDSDSSQSVPSIIQTNEEEIIPEENKVTPELPKEEDKKIEKPEEISKDTEEEISINESDSKLDLEPQISTETSEKEGTFGMKIPNEGSENTEIAFTKPQPQSRTKVIERTYKRPKFERIFSTGENLRKKTDQKMENQKKLREEGLNEERQINPRKKIAVSSKRKSPAKRLAKIIGGLVAVTTASTIFGCTAKAASPSIVSLILNLLN